MTTTLRVKRRVTGAAGAPAGLMSAELAFNMVDGIMYIGVGDDGSGNATSVQAFAKIGFNSARFLPAGGTAGQALVKTSTGDYDVAWATVAADGNYTAGTGLELVGTEFKIDETVVAQLASPSFTGSPTAPTQTTTDNSTKLATTAYVTAKINALIGGAGAAFDTFKELQDALEADESTAAALATTVSGKVDRSQNGNDFADKNETWTNLGGGTLGKQSASAVNITGGTIEGVVLDGGIF